MTQLDARLDQRLLEGERAAQYEGDEIVAPMRADISRLVDDLATAEHAVTRQVGADIEILGQRGQARIAGCGGGQQRTGLRVELAEAQEIASDRIRQDREIALDVTRRKTGGLAFERAGADGKSGLLARLRNGRTLAR